MKHTNSRFVVARLVLVVLTLAIAVFSLASCEGLPPEIQGLLGGNPNANCEHEYDNACDFTCNKCNAGDRIVSPFHYYDNDCDTDCNECGATREIEHTYENGVCSVCGAVDESVPACEHTNVENCVCKDCNEQKHTNLVLVPGVAPTCENKGYIDCYQCFGCGKVFLDADAKGEVDNNYTEIVIQPLGHNYVNNVCDRCGDCKHLTVENCVCKDCNEAVHLGILVDYAYIAPTCTENGRIAYIACDDCETILYDAETLAPITDPSEIIIPSLGGEHNYVNGVCDRCGDIDESVPNCEHTNVQDCVCKDCGEEFHKSIELLIPAGDATCDIVGSDVDIYACYDCEHFFLNAEGIGAMTEDEVLAYEGLIMPTGHNMVNSEYGTYCTKCDYNGQDVPNASHSVNTETCICEDCGATIHTFTGDDDNCIYCGESHTHEMKFIPAREATCTRTGYAFDAYKCEICEKLYSDAEGENRVDREDWIIDRLGHNYVNGTCDVCGRKNSDMPSDDGKDASDNPSES